MWRVKATAKGLSGVWRLNDRKVEHVKQGDLCGEESRTGVRALVVVMKRRNGRGAKGGRKVDA